MPNCEQAFDALVRLLLMNFYVVTCTELGMDTLVWNLGLAC